MEIANIYASVMVLVLYLCFSFLSLTRNSSKMLTSTLSFMLICFTIHAAASLSSNVLDYTHASATRQYIYCTIYSVTGHLSMYFYGKYFRDNCNATEKTKDVITKMNFVILILNLLGTLPLIPSGLYFSVTPDCIYIRGEYFILSYLFVAIELGTLSIYALFQVPSLKNPSHLYPLGCSHSWLTY